MIEIIINQGTEVVRATTWQNMHEKMIKHAKNNIYLYLLKVYYLFVYIQEKKSYY